MSSVLSLQPLWLSGLHGCTSAAGSVDSCPRESFTEIVSPEMLWTVERAKPSASAGTQHGAPTVRSAVDGMIVPIEARSERRRPAAQKERPLLSVCRKSRSLPSFQALPRSQVWRVRRSLSRQQRRPPWCIAAVDWQTSGRFSRLVRDVPGKVASAPDGEKTSVQCRDAHGLQTATRRGSPRRRHVWRRRHRLVGPRGPEARACGALPLIRPCLM